MFDIIKKLRPYFYSLREINNAVSLDIRIPVNWEYENTLTPNDDITFKVQDKNQKLLLLSIISNATQNGYDLVLQYAFKLITLNLEREEKERLLEEKIMQLKLLFEKEPLIKLKEISFIHEQKTDTTGVGVAGEGDDERFERVGSEEEEVD